MKKTFMKTIVLIVALLMIISVFAACGNNAGSSAAGNAATGGSSGVTIRLAQQYGMQYAAGYVMKELGLLEKYLPGVKIEWSELGGGSSMSEALISNQLDVGFMGLPPAIIAWDKGADYKIACGICVPPSELIVNDSSIKSLSDITADDKIAVPSVGSIQHIMLAMAAKKQLGNAKALDNNIVAMANPEAYSALISGTDIKAHFASMPYIDLEEQKGYGSILSGKDAFGDASIICVTTKAFHDSQPEAYDALVKALGDAIDLINAKDPKALSVIADTEKITEDKASEYIDWKGTIYTTDVYGAMDLASFMKETGYISKAPTATTDLMWDNAKVAK